MPPIVSALLAILLGFASLHALVALLRKYDPAYLRKELDAMNQQQQDLVAKVTALAGERDAAVARAVAAEATAAQAQADDKEFTDAIAGAVGAQDAPAS